MHMQRHVVGKPASKNMVHKERLGRENERFITNVTFIHDFFLTKDCLFLHGSIWNYIWNYIWTDFAGSKHAN